MTKEMLLPVFRKKVLDKKNQVNLKEAEKFIENLLINMEIDFTKRLTAERNKFQKTMSENLLFIYEHNVVLPKNKIIAEESNNSTYQIKVS